MNNNCRECSYLPIHTNEAISTIYAAHLFT